MQYDLSRLSDGRILEISFYLIPVIYDSQFHNWERQGGKIPEDRDEKMFATKVKLSQMRIIGQPKPEEANSASMFFNPEVTREIYDRLKTIYKMVCEQWTWNQLEDYYSY
jgi:hypothetical protein